MWYGQWRNVAPASPGGAMRRGRQNFELKLIGCKNVPYVGQLTFGGGEKIFGGTKSSRGAKKLQGAPKSTRGYKKNRKNSGDLFFLFLEDSKNCVLCRGAKNFSRGAPNGKHG